MDRRLQTEERHGGKKGQLFKRSARGWSTTRSLGGWSSGAVVLCALRREQQLDLKTLGFGKLTMVLVW